MAFPSGLVTYPLTFELTRFTSEFRRARVPSTALRWDAGARILDDSGIYFTDW